MGLGAKLPILVAGGLAAFTDDIPDTVNPINECSSERRVSSANLTVSGRC